MAELLIVVAIIAILGSLAVPTIFRVQKTTRQTELDAKAEMIYTAVQNQMIKRKAAGTDTALQATPTCTVTLPVYNSATNSYSDQAAEVHYFTSNATDEAIKRMIKDAGLEDDLAAGQWIVEYDANNAIVHSVFYSEDQANFAANYSTSYNKYREKENRVTEGAKVGYYNGGAKTVVTTPSASAPATVVQPSISVTNAEKLTVHVECGALPVKPGFVVKLTDAAGNSCTVPTSEYMGAIQKSGTGAWYMDLTLDDLSDTNSRFATKYPGLLAGTKLTITVTVQPNDSRYAETTVKAMTNSLFADASAGSEAVILNGRHLQNVDDASGVNKGINNGSRDSAYKITSYRLGTDIDLVSAADFKPIHNELFASFDGNGYVISNLSVASSTDGGLFQSLGTTDGQLVKNIMLTRTQITAGGNAGALVGSVSGRAAIKGCQVYLSGSDLGAAAGKKSNEYIWISGAVTGGLIGTVTDGTITVENCSASTVVGAYSGTAVAGGLIGKVAGGAVTVSGSYADGYLSGTQTGGLVGQGSTGLVLKSCYAAGYMTFQSGYSLTDTASISNSYSIMQELNPVSGASFSKEINAAGRVYYLPTGEEITALVSSSSEFGSAGSTPVFYHLLGQSINSYDYPTLKALRHFGDWEKGETGTFTITFDTAGGNAIDAITQEAGTPVTAPADPTRTGFIFKGWDKTIPSTMPAENITITAKWEAIKYQIRFDGNGKTSGGMGTGNMNYGESKALPLNAFVREGYTFTGWLDENGNHYSDGEVVSNLAVTNNKFVTLTAQWTPSTYAITYVLGGGTNGANPTTYTYGTGVTSFAKATREGYEFDGWYDASTGGNKVTAIATDAIGNRTLYARWKKIKTIYIIEKIDPSEGALPGGNYLVRIDVGNQFLQGDGTAVKWISPSNGGMKTGSFTDIDGNALTNKEYFETEPTSLEWTGTGIMQNVGNSYYLTLGNVRVIGASYNLDLESGSSNAITFTYHKNSASRWNLKATNKKSGFQITTPASGGTQGDITASLNSLSTSNTYFYKITAKTVYDTQ